MTTKKITVKGLVQGIGYRPFVAETAEACQIGGWVRNTDGIVTILASGTSEGVERFLHKLKINSPAGAKVEELICEEETYQPFVSFRIMESEKLSEAKEKEYPLIPADLPTCGRCLGELRNPGNRRYHHPFISCTACGPRYSIIEKLPYDRDTITMEGFQMCEICRREYAERGNVRRHAQTIACMDCGPVLQYTEILCDKEPVHGKQVTGEGALKAAVAFLQSGGILAVKDIGGYHLACTPFSEETVQRLRLLKGREKKPFAVMFPDVASVKEYCEVSDAEEALLISPPRPIVLLKKRKEGTDCKTLVANVCGSSPDIGAMLPCNPLQTMLLEALGPLIMTSANASGEVLILDNKKMIDWMTMQAGTLAVLSHDRPILTPLDDSIVREVCGRTQVIRRARGYVPNPIRIGGKKNIFAAGGDLKACFCYTGDGKAYPSQYLGDLEDDSCYQAYMKEAERMKALFGFQPEYVACDMHPGYLSAKEMSTKQNNEKIMLYRVQHHEAHVASVIAEHGLKGPVLGFAFDGTGYGRDQSIWGSEVFLWDGASMKRVAHLKPVPLIGGDEGAKNADTILYGYMASFGEETRKRWEKVQPLLPYVDVQRSRLVEKAIRHNINTVASSSMGRLFDAVSALLNICHYNGYEGEAAIELENLAATTQKIYKLSFEVNNFKKSTPEAAYEGKYPDKAMPKERLLAEKSLRAYTCEMEFCGDAESLFVGILDALEQGVPKAEIARGFLCAVSDFIVKICTQINTDACHQVALSGGTFQNRILLEQTINRLEEIGYQVYINEQMPCGDGGICLGQAFLCEVWLDKK